MFVKVGIKSERRPRARRACVIYNGFTQVERRIIPAKSSIARVVIGGNPKALKTGSMPRPRPSENRPPVKKCMVLANEAVTIGVTGVLIGCGSCDPDFA